MAAVVHHQQRLSRRRRNYVRYGVIALLVFIIYYTWTPAVREVEAISPYTVSITHKGGGAVRSKLAKGDDEKPSKPVASPQVSDGELKIAIVTFTTSESSYIYLSLRNKHAYASKHNYTLQIDYDAGESRDVGLMWHKFTMMERLIAAGEHDWIWWIDFDTLITNLDIKLSDIVHESLYNVSKSVFPPAQDNNWKSHFTPAEADGVDPEEIDLLLTADCFPLNAGSMLVRGRTPPARKTPLTTAQFLGRVREYHAANASYEHQLSEQDCMRDVLFAYDMEYTQKHVRMIPQWKTNAFPEEIKCWDMDERGWEPGSFAIHFAGAWAHIKGDDPTGQMMRKYEGHIRGE